VSPEIKAGFGEKKRKKHFLSQKSFAFATSFVNKTPNTNQEVIVSFQVGLDFDVSHCL